MQPMWNIVFAFCLLLVYGSLGECVLWKTIFGIHQYI